ncbi:HlyD family type I secretion periplasmic adaptor subunit [Falsihalocynthiibacter sp. SS001]|uniref:HlyD family type I secretion periplasmic adaptor subunit n=1 Tax=Falsihalocynthiibacter sp. SS001 TaxID=3349698 RepID=UPI0036D2340D
MSNPRWSARWPLVVGMVSAFILVGGIGVWSVRTEIAGAVVANGTIQIENDSQVIQHPDGGVVAKINARNGDFVEAGEVLVELDATFLETELTVIEGQLAEIFARKARLNAERDGDASVLFDQKPTFTLISADTVQEQIEGQTSLFQARFNSKAREKEQISRQQGQVQDKIEGLESELAAVERQLELIRRESVDVESLVSRGLAQMPRLLELQRSEAELDGRIGSLRAQIAESRTRISTLELEALRLEDARREDAITQLRDLEVNERELTERRIALVERLGRLKIVAPVSGAVFGSTVFAERAVVRAADPLMYLVPNNQPLHVLAKIDSVHVDQVYPGQDVSLVFSAFNRRTTPEGEGLISFVAADATTDEMTGLPYYEAMVQIDPETLANLEGLELIPGMPVETYIRTDLRTPLSYLMQPLSVYFARAFREE